MEYFRKISIIFSIILLLLLVSNQATSGVGNYRTIKVAFFESPGYMEKDSDGNYHGYAVEYLNKIAEYTGWGYKFIESEMNKHEKDLQNGKIDILPGILYSSSRSEKYAFPERPHISFCGTLFVRADSHLHAGDFENYNGITVAVIPNTPIYWELKYYASIHEFRLNYYYCNNFIEIMEAVNSGKCDAGALENYEKSEDTRILYEFSPIPAYFVTRKDDLQILNGINLAQNKINTDDTQYQKKLSQKYNINDERKIFFDTSEMKFIQSSNPIRVAYSKSWNPLAYKNESTGSFSGIFPDFLQIFSKSSGINFSYIECDTFAETEEMLKNGTADMSFCIPDDDNEELLYTSSFLDIPMLLISNDNNLNKPTKKYAIPEYFPDVSILTQLTRENCRTVIECFEKLHAGTVDQITINTFSANYYMQYFSQYREFEYTYMPGISMKVCLAFNPNVPKELHSIMQKTIATLTQEEINDIIINNTMKHEKMDFARFINAIPTTVALFFSGIFVLLLIMAFVIFFQSQKRRFEFNNMREMTHLISYVCNADGEVAEINLQENVMVSYVVNENVFYKRETSFAFDNISLRVHPDDWCELKETLAKENLIKLIDEESEYVFELRMKNSNDEYRWYMCSLRGIMRDQLHPNNLLMIIISINDIKERELRDKEKLQEALQMAQIAGKVRETFLSHMSHEIRTPLNAILGYLDILGSKESNPRKAQEYLRKCHEAAHQLLNIVNDILDKSAIDSGKMKINCVDFDLKRTIKSIVSIIRAQAETKEIKFTCRFYNIDENQLNGDPLRIKQILLNLLSNAIKFTPNGGEVHLKIKEELLDNNKVQLRFEVRDTGIGMKKSFMKNIFSAFEQGSPEITAKYGGSGLGLSITKNLVTMMNGTIAVDSEEAKGSCFTVSLPLHKSSAQDGDNRQRNHTQKAYKNKFQGARLLLVEDNEMNREIAVEILSRLGIQVDVACDGKEAVEKFLNVPPNTYKVILMDIQMPIMNGYEATAQIRKSVHPEAKTIPIIALTADAFIEDVSKILLSGMNNHVSKPIILDDLYNVLSKYI